MNHVSTNRVALPRRQQGVALVVALVLLLVVTIIGLASMRGTSLQERMSANMYDRSLAFQRSEAALRAAEEAISDEALIASLGGKDCSGTNACTNASLTAFAAGGANWTDVTSDHTVNGGNTEGTPQYHIQFMGTGSAPSMLGLNENADFGNYGSTYTPDNVGYYRVTVRSSDPAEAGDRAIVVLQSTVRRAF
jgi:type IV pilus assembly protein PilX